MALYINVIFLLKSKGIVHENTWADLLSFIKKDCHHLKIFIHTQLGLLFSKKKYFFIPNYLFSNILLSIKTGNEELLFLIRKNIAHTQKKRKDAFKSQLSSFSSFSFCIPFQLGFYFSCLSRGLSRQ